MKIFEFTIQGLIILSVIILFLAILFDFMFYSKRKNVIKEKTSIVATGTMTLFFFGIYLIIVNKFGVISVLNFNVKTTLIVVGALCIILGCSINVLGRFHLGRNWANHIKIYEEHVLVTKGVYKFVRHPLYASIMLMFYGACLVYRNFLSFILVTFIFLPFMYYRAKQEEKLLLQNFKVYKNYQKNTGMFFPKIRR